MELTPRISGKCQLILIPGERRHLTLRGAGFTDLRFELFADDDIFGVRAPLESIKVEGKVAEVTVAVPKDIKIERTWRGQIVAGEDVFCEFEVKFLDAEQAKSLGWE